MKVTPLASGTGVPSQSSTSTGSSVTAESKARAVAAAAGQEVPRETSGDNQVDRTQASLKKIKMKTQRSTNRHETPIQETSSVDEEVVEEVPIPDKIEVKGTEETKPLDPEVAAFLKAKRALQVKEREIAQREEALNAQAPINSGDYVSKAELLANPLKVFEAGVTYDQLTEAILNGTPSQIDPVKLRSEIKEELKQELLGEFGTRDQQAEQQVLAEVKREVMRLVDAEPDKYEAIRETKSYDTVKELVHRTWKKTGEVLSEAEAADLVEQQLIEDAMPLARIKKVQSRITPPQEQVAQTPLVPKPGTKVMRTLTNRDNASPVMDKRSRAIAAMEGRLKR